MSETLVNHKALADWSGYHTKEGLKRWLATMRISFILDRQGWPATTLDAINKALGTDMEWSLDVKAVAAQGSRKARRAVLRGPEQVDKALPG